VGILQRLGEDRHSRRQFERLVRHHQRYIFNAALRLTGGSRCEAEDLTQEAFVKAYTAFDQFEVGTNFRAWMLRILTTTHINRYRQSQRLPSTIAWDEIAGGGREPDYPQYDQVGPETAVVEQYLDNPVGTALQALPNEFRLAVILCDMFDLTYQQIATALQVPLGTVRSRIFRGRQILRERLREYAQQRGYI